MQGPDGALHSKFLPRIGVRIRVGGRGHTERFNLDLSPVAFLKLHWTVVTIRQIESGHYFRNLCYAGILYHLFYTIRLLVPACGADGSTRVDSAAIARWWKSTETSVGLVAWRSASRSEWTPTVSHTPLVHFAWSFFEATSSMSRTGDVSAVQNERDRNVKAGTTMPMAPLANGIFKRKRIRPQMNEQASQVRRRFRRVIHWLARIVWTSR